MDLHRPSDCAVSGSDYPEGLASYRAHYWGDLMGIPLPDYH